MQVAVAGVQPAGEPRPGQLAGRGGVREAGGLRVEPVGLRARPSQQAEVVLPVARPVAVVDQVRDRASRRPRADSTSVPTPLPSPSRWGGAGRSAYSPRTPGERSPNRCWSGRSPTSAASNRRTCSTTRVSTRTRWTRASAGCGESGRRVPDDVALVGVDNWEYVISGRCSRHLTTVDTELAALGAAAAAQVEDGHDAPGTHAHPCTPVVGATTAGPRPEG
ncbi:substrate-binding domain-containing protein [Streptomyces sp. NPDC087538]|uniref:substrate-binding domain-containing protein n=1 Tax=Streptomyces sp. NPDC087538 TaxID=3365797 RepID=UPI0038108387